MRRQFARFLGLGASAIEKHSKPSEDTSGPDASVSTTLSELSALASNCNDAWLSIGEGKGSRSKLRQDSLKYLRSIYFMKNLEGSMYITEEDIKFIHPGFDLPPKRFKTIIGREVVNDVERGETATFKNITP